MSQIAEDLNKSEIMPQQGFESEFPLERQGSKPRRWMDWFGSILAGLCALHCFVFMLGTLVLGFKASSLFFNPGLRWLMVLLVASLSVGSLFAGGRTHGPRSAWLMVIGLTAIIAANLWGIWGSAGEILSLCGGLMLVGGHVSQLSKNEQEEAFDRRPGRNYWPKKIGLLLLSITGVMAIYQLPTTSKILRGGSGDTLAEGTTIGWEVLAQLDVYRESIGPDLLKVVGTQVRVPGFVVPLDQEGKSFLLAPYAGACIHGPPPPTNQVIYVEMQGKTRVMDPWGWQPIWVAGKLEILNFESPFGSAGFRLEGLSTEIYE